MNSEYCLEILVVSEFQTPPSGPSYMYVTLEYQELVIWLGTIHNLWAGGRMISPKFFEQNRWPTLLFW